MNPERARRILAVLIVAVIVIGLGVAAAWVVRARDLDHQEQVAQNEAAERTRDRTAQLTFFCKQHNKLRAAVIDIVNPPGATQSPARVRALDLLAGTYCDPNQFHLDPPRR